MDETELTKEESDWGHEETPDTETGQSDGNSEPVTQTDTIVIADFGKLEELAHERNALLAEISKLLESAGLSLDELAEETSMIHEEQTVHFSSEDAGIMVITTLIGMLIGILVGLLLNALFRGE